MNCFMKQPVLERASSKGSDLQQSDDSCLHEVSADPGVYVAEIFQAPFVVQEGQRLISICAGWRLGRHIFLGRGSYNVGFSRVHIRRNKKDNFIIIFYNPT